MSSVGVGGGVGVGGVGGVGVGGVGGGVGAGATAQSLSDWQVLVGSVLQSAPLPPVG